MTPEQIAASLDQYEREWLLGWRGPPGAAYNAVAGALKAKGLIDVEWRRTATGEAARKILENERAQ